VNDRVVVLDAMGVLYRHADDVTDLLVPYVRERGCSLGTAEIEEIYRLCSLGRFDSASLWHRLGVAQAASDVEYCELHELSDGITDLLDQLAVGGFRLACLSNDVSEWSLLLRKRFGLDRRIGTWLISGDMGVRKPDPQAYRLLLSELNVAPDAVLFADDRQRNVDAAEALGIHGVYVDTIDDLGRSVRRWT
jgi:putative hydrolase of the HAD superfamily